jgi:pimeloyl-ACP methyl ester carboxylesterase
MADLAANSATDRALAELGGSFVAGTVAVNGTVLHHVRGGDGPPLVLLHGFPQDWYEWRALLPRLARRFTVVAVDLRGVGGSAPAQHGFDAATMAEDVHQLAVALGLGPAHVVGHDIGGWVAYALARLHPDSIRTATVIETLVPGIEPWLDLDLEVPLWHGTGGGRRGCAAIRWTSRAPRTA